MVVWIDTPDGSKTAFSQVYQECYSSISDGAQIEKLQKHILPAGLHCRALDEVWILDICFGLGYTAFLSAQHYYPTHQKIHIISLEKDPQVLQLAGHLQKLDSDIMQSLRESKEVCLYPNVSLRIIWGDARESIQNLESSKFDIIYQDPFSPAKNPELWDNEYFKRLFMIIKDSGIITTYTTNTRVRYIVRDCGFLVYTFKVPNIRQSSLFSKAPIHLKGANLWNP